MLTRLKKINYKLILADKNKSLKNNEIIREAVKLLKKNEVIAFPTETVYGLGADATSPEAVKKIFKIKGRPQDNPLIVHIGRKNQLKVLIKGKIPVKAKNLINEFWPGPLTVILPKSDNIPPETSAGLDTVAVRMPSHPIPRTLINLSNLPLAAPSANTSGYPSPTRAKHVCNDLKGKIPLIIDGGQCQVGVESTVIDLTGEDPVILRPGGITREQISSFSGIKINSKTDTKQKAVTDNKKNKNQATTEQISSLEKSRDSIKSPLSPGLKYRHYSPGTTLKLFNKPEDNRFDKFKENLKKMTEEKIAILATKDTAQKLEKRLKKEKNIDLFVLGSGDNFKKIAFKLFDDLRTLDDREYDLILVEIIKEKGLGEAIMNRLYKAAQETIF